MQIVVTGATKGIGLAVVERFLRSETAPTVIMCARDAQLLDTTAIDLRMKYPNAAIHFSRADLSVREDVESFASFVRNVGTTDILVNNAGIFMPGACHEEPDGRLEMMIHTNLYSAYYLTRALLPEMIAAGKGHIFNICSIAALQAYPNGGSYSISKFAMDGFSKNLREELKPLGIKVTSVYPGATYTDSWSGTGVDPKRIMEASDVANMIYAAAHLSVQADVENIVLRPQLGDL